MGFKNYSIASLGLLAALLVYNLTTATGASNLKKDQAHVVDNLKLMMSGLEQRISSLENQNQENSLKISQLNRENKNLRLSLNQKNKNVKSVVNSKNQVVQKIVFKKINTKNSAVRTKVFFSQLEISGFATFDTEFVPGQNALDQLLAAAQKYRFDVKTTAYDFGTFINCIGATCGDANHFWSLSKNGISSPVGAQDLLISLNDRITWDYVSF